MDDPGKNEVTLSNRVSFDPETFGSVVRRIEAIGGATRKPDPND